jgi:hypothetical protein
VNIRGITGMAAGFAAVVASAVAAAGPTSRDAASFRQKVATIVASGERQGRAAAPQRTTVLENEVNAYLALEAKDQIPAGVVDPAVSILGDGRVSGRATVDLDAVRRQQNPTSLLDPASYLSGRVPVTAVGMLNATGGVGRFTLESATAGGVPVPKFLLQQIVSYYSRGPDFPNGINIDDPFALPARIREIQVQRGQAIIVQ